MRNQCKFDARKRNAQIMNNTPKGCQNGSRNRENINKNKGSKNIEIFITKGSPPNSPDLPKQSTYRRYPAQKNTTNRKNNIKGCTRWGTSNNQFQHAREPAARSGFWRQGRRQRRWPAEAFGVWQELAGVCRKRLERPAPRKGGGGF